MSIKDTCVSLWESLTVTLSGGTSLTDAIKLGGLRVFAIAMPAVWTTANLTFQMSPDGGTTWLDIRDQNGNELTVITGASMCLLLDPSQFAALPLLRLRSGTSATPVAQSADRQIQLILRSV